MKSKAKKIRYAVVGLGYISQVAVLPAFKNAAKNSELAALVSGTPKKLKQLQKKYNVPNVYSYDEYEDCLRSGYIDAVYIALPNSMHHHYSVLAAKNKIHVLCEKPMATTVRQCREMIDAAAENHVKLMTAYRLHFEKANLAAIDIARSGRLGDLRIFNSLFTMQVKDGNNIRLNKELGGGSVYDLGIYCLNAARNLFRAEPTEVLALSAKNDQKRFAEVDEMTGALLRFPNEQIATFTSSFGAADVSSYQIVGTKGSLTLDPAYEIAEPLKYTLKIGDREQEKVFGKRDQFAPELSYFSNCILKNIDPEPSGKEGLADVRVIEALYESARTGKSVRLAEFEKTKRPSLKQEEKFPAFAKPDLIEVQAPSPE